jgi:3',5'-cyclic AMP phosphodiesterase CpdA
MQIIQFSDTHIKLDGLLYDLVDAEKNVSQSIDYFCKLKDQPYCYVVTGDLVASGKIDEYKELNKYLDKLPRPVYILPGNHDDRDNIHKIFHSGIHDKAPVENDIYPYISYEIPVPEVNLKVLVVDTHVSHQHWGTFSHNVENWLSKKLSKYYDKNVLVFTHHLPYRVHLDEMDELMDNGNRFLSTLKKHPNIKLCTGHMHTPVMSIVDGVPIQTCPAISMQMEIDFKLGGGSRFFDGDPGYVIHDFYDGRVVSHTIQIPLKRDWAGPKDFTYSNESNKSS